jgi:HemY protein
LIRVLSYLAVVTLAAFGVVWFADRPGQVSILWQGYAINTSVAMAVVGVLVLAFAALMLFVLLRFIFGLPTAFGFASRARRRAKGYEAISRGMLAVASGDAVAATRHMADARRLAGDEPMTLLLEAQTAQVKGDRATSESTFKAMLDQPQTRVLGLRGLFVEARRNGDADAAQALAEEAVKLAPSLGWANDALLEFASTRGDWGAARIAVERRAALKLADKHQAKRQRAVLLAAEAQSKEDSKPDEALAAALEAVKLAPGLVPAAALAGRLLVARNEVRKASRILEAAWKETPHPDLAAPYVHARHGDAANDRLARAESLARLAPSDPESALTVAQAAIEARQFAKARQALVPLIAGGATTRVCLMMSEIEEAENGATGKVREWLARAARAPRDPVWIADGVISQTWRPISPVTGALDAFVWSAPPLALGASIEPAAMPDIADDGPPAVLPAPAAETVIDEPPVVAPPVDAAVTPPVTAAEVPAPEPAVDAVVPEPVVAASAEPARDTPALRFAETGRPPDDPGPDAGEAAPARQRRWYHLFG